MTANSMIETEENSDAKPVLELENVKVHFTQSERGLINWFIPGVGDEQTVKAVDGVSLEIEENDVLALVGESGCGKTTLGKAAVALERPTGGSIKYRGEDIWEAKRGNADAEFSDIRRALQIVHQDPGSSLNPNRRVRKSLEGVLKRWYPDLDANDRRERILAMLERTGITPPEDYADRFPHQLSGGEKQRIALIRALLMNPDIILADESISALDVSLRIEMMDLMLELQDIFNTSYIFISHNLSNARYIVEKAGGKIAVMYLGKLVEVGTVDEIIHDAQHPYTKALNWATPELEPDSRSGEVPVRGIDIPDPVNPPSGCSFHPRCPEARKICQKQEPDLIDAGPGIHRAACYRADEDHEYWSSEPLIDE